MSHLSATFARWRESLAAFHDWFAAQRARTRFFALKLFGVFVAINFACFWWAVLTAYPEKIAGPKALEYAALSAPVALFGALFDIVSLSVTLWAIDKALEARHDLHYLAFLAIDLVIAVVATFWVLFVFVFSGWLVGYILPLEETLGDRAQLYQDRVTNVFASPFSRESIKNVYFGVMMGASALIPTIGHALFAVWAGVRTLHAAAASRAKP